MRKLFQPSILKKGDNIAIISPAGNVDSTQLQSTISLIESNGYNVQLSPNSLGLYENGYKYSGTEKDRLNDLNWALNDANIKAVWASRGGYGAQHLLERIKLNGFKDQPKWYIGYSDNTVIQSFLLKKGYPSIHGQTVKTSSFGVSEKSYSMIFSILKGEIPEYQIKGHKYNETGNSSGVLVGGNLALIYALMGTKYSFDFRGKILFIEDVGESFYSIDRMISSLELAGVFKQIKGLIVGGMNNMGSEKDNSNFEESFDPLAYSLIKERLEKYDFPVVFGFPNGHIFENWPLIIGAQVTIDVKKEKVKIGYQSNK